MLLCYHEIYRLLPYIVHIIPYTIKHLREKTLTVHQQYSLCRENLWFAHDHLFYCSDYKADSGITFVVSENLQKLWIFSPSYILSYTAVIIINWFPVSCLGHTNFGKWAGGQKTPLAIVNGVYVYTCPFFIIYLLLHSGKVWRIWQIICGSPN